MKNLISYAENRKKASLTLVLLAALLCASCGTAGETPQNAGTEAGGNAGQTEATETEPVDSLPELDFAGQTVVIHARGDSLTEIDTDAMNGSLVNDLIYERNMLVEDRLNVQIEAFGAEGWENYNQAVTKLIGSISAGDGAYDLVAGWSARIPSISTMGCLHDLAELEYLNLDSPWWNQSCRTELQLGDSIYFVTGDASLTFLTTMCVYAFNKKAASENDVENLYTVVNEHRWTVEYVDRLTRDLYQDVNGDGKVGPEDFFGITTSSINDADGYLQGFRATMSVRDDKGYPLFTPDLEFLGQIAEKVYALTWDNPGCLTNTGDTTDLACFMEDRALLAVTRVGNVTSKFADMESDYGVLPYPLFSESQESYGTRLQDGVSLWCVPTDVKDTALSSAVLEALGSQSARTVTPQYFDLMLKNRYSRDTETAQMMDLIKNSVWITFDSLYNESIGYPWHYLRYMMMGKNKNFTSYWASSEKTYNREYEKLISQFKEQAEN